MLTVVWRGHLLGMMAGTWHDGDRWSFAYQPRSALFQDRPPRRTVRGRIDGKGARLVLDDNTARADLAAIARLPSFQPSAGYAALVRDGDRAATAFRVSRETDRAKKERPGRPGRR